MDSNKAQTDKKSDPLDVQFIGNTEEQVAEKLAQKNKEQNASFTFKEIAGSILTAAAFFAVALVIAVILPIVL